MKTETKKGIKAAVYTVLLLAACFLFWVMLAFFAKFVVLCAVILATLVPVFIIWMKIKSML